VAASKNLCRLSFLFASFGVRTERGSPPREPHSHENDLGVKTTNLALSPFLLPGRCTFPGRRHQDRKSFRYAARLSLPRSEAGRTVRLPFRRAFQPLEDGVSEDRSTRAVLLLTPRISLFSSRRCSTRHYYFSEWEMSSARSPILALELFSPLSMFFPGSCPLDILPSSRNLFLVGLPVSLG